MAYPYQKRSLTGELESFFGKLTNFHIAVPLMFVMIFLYINGSYYWGPAWEQTTALVYILLFAFAISLTRNSSLMWLSKTSFKDGAMNFWLGFILMLVGLVALDAFVLNGSLSGRSIASSAVYPAIAITVFFVAPVEETIFRGVLKDYFKPLKFYWVPLGMLITSVMFAILHVAVYQGQVMSLWWAFLMGCVFYLGTGFKPFKSRNPLGVPGAIGMHSCYNLFVLGILTGGIV